MSRADSNFTTALLEKKPKEFKMKKDPWKAVLYSALLPGAGQYYNKSYWKIPVVLGLGGYFGYGLSTTITSIMITRISILNLKQQTIPVETRS